MKAINFPFVILLFICLILASDTFAQTEAGIDTIINEFKSQVEQDVASDKNKGSISITILKGEQTLYSGAYGHADYPNGIEADSNKIYRTGSISKTFTAFLMMQLLDEGIIELDEPVEKYLPEIVGLKGYSDSTKITFHHLASHTSGLIREPKLRNAASGPIDGWEEKILESIPKTSFQTGMDVAYSYSNIGFGILGLALSRAADKPFMQLVEEKIFEPLGLENTYWIVPEEKMPELAVGMMSNGKGKISKQAAEEHLGRGYKVPNGGVYSTPEDLKKFMNAIMGYGNILSSESQIAMVSSHTPEDKYGYGLSLFEDEIISTAGHGGSVAGYTCYMAYDKESEFGVIVMRNYNEGNTNLGRGTLDLIKALKEN